MTYPFKQARWYYHGRQGIQPRWIVLHSAETDELANSAEGVAAYFASTDRKASAHLTSDSDSVVRSVLDTDTAFGAKDANNLGLHMEHAGRARQTAAEWDDPYSRAMLADQSAPAVALWCREYGIPARFVDAAGLKRGDAGITTHAEVSKAFPSTGHTDPGPNFPIVHYLDLVRSHLTHPVPQPPQGDDVPHPLDITSSVDWPPGGYLEQSYEGGLYNYEGAPLFDAFNLHPEWQAGGPRGFYDLDLWYGVDGAVIGVRQISTKPGERYNVKPKA